MIAPVPVHCFSITFIRCCCVLFCVWFCSFVCFLCVFWGLGCLFVCFFIVFAKNHTTAIYALKAIQKNVIIFHL